MKLKLRHQKNAVLYLLVAVVFLSVMAIAFFILSVLPPSAKDRASIERIYTIDRFLTDFEQDIDRAAHIAAFRALLAMEEKAIERGSYYSDVQQPFEEAFTYGSINGSVMAIMTNATLNDYQASVRNLAGRIGLDFSVNLTNATLTQTDPWYVTVTMSFVVNVTDRRGLASWNYAFNRTTNVPILDLRDPVSAVVTEGKIQTQIKKTNTTLFVNDTGNKNDTTALQRFINASEFRQSPHAPSLLMRFTGNLSSSPYGIESIVYIPTLNSQGLVINGTRSVVDYLYYGGAANGNNPIAAACQIQNLIYTPDWVQLDNAHLDDYNITGALSYNAC